MAATFGRGAMTNHWKDIKNADVVLVMGANPAENHPCGFKWAVEAREQRGAKIVTVDPRFTRTSAVADKHLQIRPGSDIAVLGGFIHYMLENGLEHTDYVKLHTNASFIVRDDFGFADGLFTGYDEAAGGYDKTTWDYERGADGFVLRDMTLQDPRCVYQLLKSHYSRYTPEVVARIAGCTPEGFVEMAKIVCSTGRPERVGTIMYAVGWTMHTVGSQIIRTAAIMQLLLGNIGRPGGGINALRGHANVQGATDHAIVAGITPGYLKVPTPGQTSLAVHLEQSTPKPLTPDTVNYWGNYPKFFVSQLKTWYGDKATADNEFGYHFLGKQDGDATWLSIWDRAYRGKMEGLVTLGFNPILAGPDTGRLMEAIGRSSSGWPSSTRSCSTPPSSGRRRGWTARRSTPRSSTCRAPTGWSGTARSPTAVAGPSGSTRRSIRRRACARTRGSSPSSSGASSSATRTRAGPTTRESRR